MHRTHQGVVLFGSGLTELLSQKRLSTPSVGVRVGVGVKVSCIRQSDALVFISPMRSMWNFTAPLNCLPDECYVGIRHVITRNNRRRQDNKQVMISRTAYNNNTHSPCTQYTVYIQSQRCTIFIIKYTISCLSLCLPISKLKNLYIIYHSVINKPSQLSAHCIYIYMALFCEYICIMYANLCAQLLCMY